MLSSILAAALIIRGEIQTPAGKPLAGARVSWSETQSTDTSEDGHFLIYPGRSWPSEIVVKAHGYGTHHIPVPRRHASFSIDPITVHQAASIRVHVERRETTAPLDVLLGIARDDEPQWVDRRRLDSHEGFAEFTDLEAGTYVVLVRGQAPLESASAKAVVGEGDVRDVAVPLIRHRLKLHIKAGDQPVRNARVRLGSLEFGWRVDMQTDRRGDINALMWDGGSFEVSIHRVPEALPIIRVVTFKGSGEASITLPDRTLRGRVMDSHSVPVPNAFVFIETPVNGGVVSLRVPTDLQGRFVFDGLEPGRHRLRVVASSFLLGEPIDEDLSLDDRVSEIVLHVSEGRRQRIAVLSPDGAPMEDAEIVCATGATIRSRAYTDVQGTAIVPLPDGEPNVLYVIPREGSFAISRLATAAQGSNEPVIVTVPPGRASLRMKAISPTGELFRGVNLLVRVDGELIPLVVAKELLKQQSVDMRVNESGELRMDQVPIGTYEFWLADDENMENLIESIGASKSPITMQLTPGDNQVTVRFASKR